MLHKYAVEKGSPVESSQGWMLALFNAQFPCYYEDSTKTRLGLIQTSVGFVMQI